MPTRLRILITGASGMLGSCLVEEFAKRHSVFATSTSKPTWIDEDIFMPFDLENGDYNHLLEWARPDLIIHSAAWTNGNECNNYPERALKINGLTSDKLLKYSNPETKIIYISSDAVFPSVDHLPTEFERTSPESIYGKSKELGEFFLLNSERNCCVLRTTIVGYNKTQSRQGFVEWMINSCKESRQIGLFDDVIFSPITIWELAKIINQLLNFQELPKIIHAVSRDFISKYQFGFRLIERLNLDKELLVASSIEQFKERAKRSKDQTLSVEFATDELNLKLPSTEETISELSKKYLDYE